MKIHNILIISIIIISIILLFSSRDKSEDQSVENLGAGGISIRGAVYPPYPGDPYGYDYSIMPDCLHNCCDREACDRGFGCRWNSGGKNYTGLVKACLDHKKCIKDGGTEEQCKKESGSLMLV